MAQDLEAIFTGGRSRASISRANERAAARDARPRRKLDMGAIHGKLSAVFGLVKTPSPEREAPPRRKLDAAKVSAVAGLFGRRS